MAEPTRPADHPHDRQDTAVQPTENTQYATWSDTAVLPGPTDPPTLRRSPDPVALVAGVLFCLVAVLGVVGTALPGWVFGGGLVAVVLVVLGAGLLVTELRRVRR